MKAGKWCVGLLAVGILAFGMTAYGQEIRWEPVSSDCGGATIDSQVGSNGVPSEISMLAGGCEVTMEIKVSGFGSAPGAPDLGAYQGTLDCLSLGDLTQKTPWGDHAVIDGSRSDFVYFDNVAVPAVSVATCDFEYGSTQMGGAEVDLGISYYGGTMIVVVPPTAKGTYELNWNPADTKTFFNDAFGGKIPGLFRTTGKITVITGKCCYNIGPGTTMCAHGMTQAECNAEAAPRLFFPGEICEDGEGLASPDDCPSCQNDGDCYDYDACTEDHCDTDGTAGYGMGVCYYFDLYEPMTECCNGADGAVTLFDDGNDCTADSCEMLCTVGGNPCNSDADCAGDTDVCNGTGVPVNDPLTGTACDHPNACVINDECDAGVCVGDLPGDLMIGCAIDEDCPSGWFCNVDPLDPMFEYCDCRLSTPLCPEFDDVCYEEGDPVYAVIAMEAGSAEVTGGQFLMTYDPTCIEFVSIGPCAGSIFTTVIDWWVDEIEGVIWYAVIAYDELTYEVQSTTGPYDIACMEFVKLAGCDPCNMCLTSDNPYNTLLTDIAGKSVDIDDPECCSDDIMLDGDMDMWVPAGAEVNADCGVTYSEILWDAPHAWDDCLGPLELVCDLEHDGGVPLDPALIMTGGIFPQGTTYFVCTATDDVCGGEITKVWTVSVSDQQTMDVEVHLSPTMFPGLFSRCICFDLYVDCVAPEHVCTVMDFNGPYNFDAHARKEFKVDKGNYLCIEARDPLHTLRSTAGVECIDNKWTAVFKGDPLLGEYGDAHWLIGGNLDFHEPAGNPDVIDVLDFGVYMSQASVGTTFADGNTACDTPAPHADINADGVVDSLDYAFLTENFLADSKIGCCEEPGSGSAAVLDITVKELRETGRAAYAVADLNNDGHVNTEDMALYQGAQPQPAKVKRVR